MSLSDDIAALTGARIARWNADGPLGTPVFVTYTFPTSPKTYDPFGGFVLASETHKNYIRTALSTWDAVSGIHFLEVPESAGGQIRFSLVDLTGTLNARGAQASGYGYNPTGGVNDLGGDAYLNAQFYAADAATIAPGQRGYSIVLHETGHVIGLKHPFEGTPTIDPAHDSGTYTIMSYNRSVATTSLGSVDIAATQFLYGLADAEFSWDPQTLSLTINGTNAAETRIGTELNDTLNGLGGADLLNGKTGLDTATYSGAFADYKLTPSAGGQAIVTDLRPGSPDGEDTLVNIEQLRFSDMAIPVSALAGVPAVVAAATAALGGVMTPGRSDLQARELNGSISFAQYVDGLIQEGQKTSVPALIVANALGGSVPTKEHLAELMAFASDQLQSYRAMGVATPELGPYEALGRGFAATDAFRSEYGGLTQSDFVKGSYREAFGRDPSAVQQQHFEAQASYFKGLYQAAGIAEAQSVLLARGAVFGQMLGHAVRDEPNLHAYDEAANAFLRQAIDNQAGYGQPLDLI
jgi:hypothetical protein